MGRVELIEVPAESELQQQLLSPGDIFYMPAGTWHRAEAGEYSLALTIGCRSSTFADLLFALMARQLDGDAEWRRILPALADARDDSRLRAVFRDRIAQLKSWVASLDSEALISEWQKSVVADGQQSSDDEKRAIERSDRLVVPHQLSCSTEGEQLMIRCQGSSFAVPLHLRFFIERLSARKTLVADEALGWCEADEELDWPDVSEALQTLLEQGIIRRQSDSSGPAGE
jgi:ribosomal protein L16 Arg81 hydroxylase